MEVSKIHLSSAEMELMQNAEVILTKNRVLEKMKNLLEEVQEKQVFFSNENHLANDIFNIHPKISRGENYLGLPYLILDYPRQSSGKNFFFIRTMFWWGNFFSCTLHLAGDSKKIFKEKIKQCYQQLGNYHIGISDEQWVHHLKETDYANISSMTKEKFESSCECFNHIKLSSKHSLTQWQKAPYDLFNDWKFFLSVCGLIP
jgi:hypothetical protein